MSATRSDVDWWEPMSVDTEGPADSAAAPKRISVAPRQQYITWIALAMMTTSSVASLRSAPSMAVYGLACGRKP